MNKVVLVGLGVLTICLPANAQQQTRSAAQSDLDYLNKPENAAIQAGLVQMNLSPVTVGQECAVFIITRSNSNGPVKVHLPLIPQTSDAPYPPFRAMTLWDVKRPFGEAILLHLYGEPPNWILPYNGANGYAVTVYGQKAPDYPSAQWVHAMRPALQYSDDVAPAWLELRTGGEEYYSIRSYSFSGEAFNQGALTTTCFNDANKFKECICVGSMDSKKLRLKEAPPDPIRASEFSPAVRWPASQHGTLRRKQ